jgi:hypothetical protein
MVEETVRGTSFLWQAIFLRVQLELRTKSSGAIIRLKLHENHPCEKARRYSIHLQVTHDYCMLTPAGRLEHPHARLNRPAPQNTLVTRDFNWILHDAPPKAKMIKNKCLRKSTCMKVKWPVVVE